jgi:hypothetical protein
VKAYREVCADLIILLEDIEESLEEISKAAELSESQPKTNEVEMAWSERPSDCSVKN